MDAELTDPSTLPPPPMADGADQPSHADLFGDSGSDSDDDDDENNPLFAATTAADHASMTVSNIPSLKSSVGPAHTVAVTKLPNIVGLVPTAFEEEEHDAEKEALTHAYTSTIVRWRYKSSYSSHVKDADGARIRESNTRIVEWSDGSRQLQVGSELFDLVDTPLADAIVMQNQVSSQNGVSKTTLQGQATIASKLTVKPASLHSEAHKSLTLAVRRRNVKQNRMVLIADSTTDPEKEAAARARAVDDAERKRKGGKGGSKRVGMDRSYLEGDDEQGDIRAIRRKAQEEDFGEDSSSDEEAEMKDEEEKDEWEQERGGRKRRAPWGEKKEEEDTGGEKEVAGAAAGDDDSDDDEDDEEAVVVKKKSKAIIDDDDE